jgi:hypothetical protein
MDVGYSIYLSPKAGDLLGYPFPRIYLYNDLPETLYASSFLIMRNASTTEKLSPHFLSCSSALSNLSSPDTI